MGWFSDRYDDRTAEEPKQGFFESNRDYQDRVYLEGKERTIEESSGSAPKQGFFENDESYRSRIAHEANELIVEKNHDSSPRQGFFESDSSYRERMHHEANASIVEGATGSVPKQGLFESDTNYHDRMTEAAASHIVEAGSGVTPRQGIFESDDNFRIRINHAARKIQASTKAGAQSDPSLSDYNSPSASYGTYSEPRTVDQGNSAPLVLLVLLLMAVVVFFSNSDDKSGKAPQRSIVKYLRSGQPVVQREEFGYEFPKKYPAQFEALRRIFPPDPGPASSLEWLYTLQGVAGPIMEMSIGGRRYLASRVCKPHDCAENMLVFLIAEDGSRAIGKLRTDGPEEFDRDLNPPLQVGERDLLDELETL